MKGVTSRPTQSIEELFKTERLGLIRLGYLLSGSRELAEDAVQIAFAEASARWDQIDNHTAYLKRVVVNRIKDEQRRSARRPTTRLLHRHVEPVTSIPEIDETWHLIQDLPWVQQAVVVLRFYEDLPLVEIAELLGRRPSTIRSDLRRALARLRKAL